ncbi:MAG: hypothetical protein HZC29_01000 [Thaumarchaeota archaeon]|nr:hypothetical protein [Nitrososphaerota archaeon]
MASLTPEETRAFVEKLVIAGKGDPGRLNHILVVLREGRKLYGSDQKYLDAKLAQEIGLQEKLKVEESALVKVQKLIASGTGDTGRLQFILESLKQGKKLYRSDQQYLEAKLGEKVNYETLIKESDDSNKTIQTLKSQVTWANEKITNLESILNEKMGQLQSSPTITKSTGTLPKGWQDKAPSASLDQIQKQLSVEQEKLSHEKTEQALIRYKNSFQ